MTLIEELKQRGFIHQCTNEKALGDLLNSESIKFYIGFDCTAKSLHVGSLIQIMIMRLFQKYGHHPIVLIGKGTTKIGDPSGKDETRKILSSKDIDTNASNLEKVFNKFLDFQSNNKAILSDNSLWLDKLNYINFLRDYGKHFTINKMLSFDSVKIRLEREQSLSFVEFNYMIFQAYDFFELNKRNECILQIGGSDQWGNIVNGIELIRRSIGKESFGLTTPLLTNANGDKMGKTADGAIWLNEEFFSSYDYWQFWRNIDDRDVFRFLKLFTDLPIDEIDKIESDSKDNINLAKIILANHATTLLHGKDAASIAEQTAQDTFSGDSISENLPKISLLEKEFIKPVYIYDLIVKIGFSNSKSEARKLIRGHGVKLNQSVVKDELYELILEDVLNNKVMISVGKKKHFIVEVTQ
ncbi:MAG: tyrosine--tRNA ligase [Candidatus Pelagibacterales bacterium]